MLPAQGLGYSPQGQGSVEHGLAPRGPSRSYTNESIHERLTQYREIAQTVHGPEYDLTTADLDGEIVMRVGGGKKHRRYWICNSTLDSATTPTLYKIRARSTSASPAIRPRLDTATHRVVAIQVISVLFVIH